MKKRLKKILAVVLLFTLVFTFTVKPKKADAFIGEMTLAGIAASAGTAAMLPYALGAAGILAVGGVITNWDVVKDYGEKVINKFGGADAAAGNVNLGADGTATVIYSPAMKAAMAQAVDDMPAQIIPPTSFQGLGTVTGWNQQTVTGLNIDISDYKGNLFTIDATYKAVSNNGYYLMFTLSTNGGSYESKTVAMEYVGVVNGKYRFQYRFPDSTAYEYGVVSGYQWNLFDGATTNEHTSALSYALGELSAGVPIDTADTFGMVADNVNARLLGMNAVIADNQAVTISADAELLNASIDDLASISDATLTETQTQTGILSQIWRAIVNLPNSIAVAASSAAAAINTKAQDLWDDAGAIWTGLADTATGIRADITAKMGALQDAMAGGIDNVRSGINDMIASLSSGIDTISSNMAAWGQLTLDGIDAGIGAITSGLNDTWTNITAKITEGVGTITGSITTAMDDIRTWVTDFPTTMLRVFVPPNFDFMQPLITATTTTLKMKFGPLETLPNVFRNIFGAGKSIYDIEITVLGHTYKIVPIFLKPVIDGARPFLTGAINLVSLTILYRRYKGNLVIPT